MPTISQDGSPASEVEVTIPFGVAVVLVKVRHLEVSFYDVEGREAFLVQRLAHPGAGLDFQVADFVPGVV
jgi:hypothetical protein